MPVPSQGTTDTIRELLRAIFDGGEAATLFIVLRNGESLPEGMSGTDLDLSVRPGCGADDVVRFLCARGETIGWKPVCISRRPHMTGFSLIKADGASGASAVHFDVFEGITYLCLPLLAPDVLDGESVVQGGVRQLSARGRVLATTVHHLAWNGALLKEKYRDELAALLTRSGERDWLLRSIDATLGPSVSHELRKADRVTGLGASSIGFRLRLWRGLTGRWLWARPRLAIRSVARYVGGQLGSLRHPPGVVGCPGDHVPGLQGTPLTLELACRISPHAVGAANVRASPTTVRTHNGPRYERSTALVWRAWTPVRWLWPSLFLFVQAKRNRIVILDRLPIGVRWLRARPRPPGWVARPTEAARGRGPISGVLAGLCDSGLSSLATFLAGMFAARMLGPGELGSYALVFSAFVVACMIPAQSVFTPAEVAALEASPRDRRALIGRTARLGSPIALLSAVGMIAWIGVAPPEASRSVVVALTMTAALAAFVSPIQDHLRRMLHLADASWYAAAVSLVHLATLAAVLGFWTSTRIPPVWLPFGALAVANAISLAVGTVLAKRRAGASPALQLNVRTLAREGRWLLAIGLLPTVTGFGAAVLISRLADVTALGHAEAARILTQPLFVLSTGLSAFLGPRSMEAGRGRLFHRAQRISRVFVGLVLGTGIPYLLLTGIRWHWSPLPRLIPTAYAVDGLVAATAAAMIVSGLVFPYRSELLGAGRARTLAEVEAAGNAVRLAVGGLAGALGAFAVPAGLACLGIVRAGGYWAALRRHYPARPDPTRETVHPEPRPH